MTIDQFINKVIHGDCIKVMRSMPDDCVHSIVTDPPYELGFMGKHWDKSGIAYNVEVWQECLRVLKPGGHLLAFGGSRTYHRMACAIEDAGFEIRDQIMWIYGSGFPKSLDVSKAIDKAAGTEREPTGIEPRRKNPRAMMPGGAGLRKTDASTLYDAPATDSARQWSGWGTALKPAHEPIVVARKPLIGTVAENVLAHGTGAMNIDGCRVGTSKDVPASPRRAKQGPAYSDLSNDPGTGTGWDKNIGRWPANVTHDGSEEVVGLFPKTKSGALKPYKENHINSTSFHFNREKTFTQDANSGSAARFFYCAKASKQDRVKDNHHPTVKPHDLMRYLCRLVTPPNGIVLDPFAGSGSTCKAAVAEGFRFIGIEIDNEYCLIANGRLSMTTFGLPL